PTTPIVLPASSTPSHRARSHAPAFSAPCACGMFRACASNRASVCSAALITLDWGAFTTITPRRVAASTSTLSSPIPARATTFRFAAASKTSAVTLVALRMMSASYGPISSSSPPCARSARTSTWKSLRSRSSPCSERCSVTRTRTTLRLGFEEHAFGRRDRGAALHRMSDLLQGQLERREAANDVELADVPEVPDPEDGPLQGALARRKHDAVVATDPCADRIGVGSLGGADRGDGPILVEALAEQIQPERLHAL